MEKKNEKAGTGIPRILYLKLRYGDDFMDYIKEEVGVENFLRDKLSREDEKTSFLQNDLEVKEFSSHWFILTDYYKSKFGKRVRDKDAVDNLSKIYGFKILLKVYDFRCALFKADFYLNDKFRKDLTKNLLILKRITTKIVNEKQKKNEFLIKNKIW